MIHHLRGTSAALAEKVFIRGGKRHGNYGRGPRGVSFADGRIDAAVAAAARRMAPGMLSEIIMRLAVLLAIVYSLFATFSLAADPSSSAAIPDRVTAAASHPRNEPGPTKSGALCDAPRTKAPRIIPVGVCLLPEAMFACAHTRRRSRAR